MGWNDHVEFAKMKCLNCKKIDIWECWDELAKVRYGGQLGRKLGHDIKYSDRCPHCGSTRGKQIDEDEDY